MSELTRGLGWKDRRGLPCRFADAIPRWSGIRNDRQSIQLSRVAQEGLLLCNLHVSVPVDIVCGIVSVNTGRDVLKVYADMR